MVLTAIITHEEDRESQHKMDTVELNTIFLHISHSHLLPHVIYTTVLLKLAPVACSKGITSQTADPLGDC